MNAKFAPLPEWDDEFFYPTTDHLLGFDLSHLNHGAKYSNIPRLFLWNVMSERELFAQYKYAPVKFNREGCMTSVRSFDSQWEVEEESILEVLSFD